MGARVWDVRSARRNSLRPHRIDEVSTMWTSTRWKPHPLRAFPPCGIPHRGSLASIRSAPHGGKGGGGPGRWDGRGGDPKAPVCKGLRSKTAARSRGDSRPLEAIEPSHPAEFFEKIGRWV